MVKFKHDPDPPVAERVVRLVEQGLTSAQIRARVGCSSSAVRWARRKAKTMKRSSVLVTALLVSGCVTSGDLRSVSDSLARVEAVVDDQGASVDDVEAAIAKAKEEIGVVADTVEDRTTGLAAEVGQFGGGGIIPAVLSAVALNFLRNRTRKTALAEVRKT